MVIFIDVNLWANPIALSRLPLIGSETVCGSLPLRLSWTSRWASTQHEITSENFRYRHQYLLRRYPNGRRKA